MDFVELHVSGLTPVSLRMISPNGGRFRLGIAGTRVMVERGETTLMDAPHLSDAYRLEIDGAGVTLYQWRRESWQPMEFKPHEQ